ncbi:MAG: hypothetical protein QXX12_01065 [Nanopusillaceae archaeon]
MAEQVLSWVLQAIVSVLWVPVFQRIKRKTGWKGLGLEWVVWITVYLTAVVLGLALRLVGMSDLSPAAIFAGQGTAATMLNQVVYMGWKSIMKLLEQEGGAQK